MKKEIFLEQFDKVEQAGKRLHLLLYGNKEDDPQYIQWRDDLETTIYEFVEAHKERIINIFNEELAEIKRRGTLTPTGEEIYKVLEEIRDTFNPPIKI